MITAATVSGSSLRMIASTSSAHWSVHASFSEQYGQRYR